MRRDFGRILIVDRDEGAMRLINAVREFNQESGTSIRTVALRSDADRQAMFVREADEVVGLETAEAREPADPGASVSRRHPGLEATLRESGADAAWVGWGLGAPDAEFASLCERLGVVFVGPDSGVIRRFGDRAAARALAAGTGIPVPPGGGARSPEDGRGAARAAGARQVGVQVIADHSGHVWAVGTRSTTVRWRNRRLVEEAPAPGLTAAEGRELERAAVRLAADAGYRSAGTFGFLFDPAGRTFSFDEVRVGLEPAHAVTEVTSGVDLVKLQLHVARGGVLEGDPPVPMGHAVGARISAEEQDDSAAPVPGRIVLLRLPTGPGLRVDRGVTEGDRVSPRRDPLVARVVAHGQTRSEALARLRRALSESAIVLSGGMTNKAFLLELIDRPEVRGASEGAGALWLEDARRAAGSAARPNAHVALLNAAIDVDEAERAVERREFLRTAARMRPIVRRDAVRTVELRHGGQRYQAAVQRTGRRTYRIAVDGGTFDVAVDRLGPYERWLHCGSRRWRMVSVAEGTRHTVEADGVAHRFVHDDTGIVRAPAPAVVAALHAKAGDRVALGQPLAVLEAMKMETPVLAPVAGTVRQVFVVGNAQVGQGDQILRIDPAVPPGEAPGERIAFGALAPRPGPDEPAPGWRENLLELRQLVLGFDLTPSDARRIAGDYDRVSRSGAPETPERRRAEDEVLSIFGDVLGLFRRQSRGSAPDPLDAVSTGEYLLTYVRTLDAEGTGLPARFRDRLRRALLHYGVDSLSPSPDLEEALVCIFKARDRAERMIPAVLAILERRTAGAASDGGPKLRTVLDRIASVAENRYPPLFDLARDARYRFFDQPLFEEARRRIYSEMEGHVAALQASPAAPDRAARIQALVDCPQPLEGLFAGRFPGCEPRLGELMLEILTRRFYRTRNLEGLETGTTGGWSVARASYDLDGQRIHVVSAHAPFPKVAAAVAALRPVFDSLAPDRSPVLDLYAYGPGAPADPDESAAALAAALDGVVLGRPLRRVFVALAGASPGGAGGRAPAVGHFTFRRGADGYAEDRSHRGLHPLIAKRLQLWRLRDFDLERLPSVEDVYLFRGVARENRKDERLFAMAEVRDLTPERDAAGKIAGLPQLERMLFEALASIRHFQSKRRAGERLQWSRVLLDVWPPFLLDGEELGALSRKIGRATEGVGLEKVTVRARVPGASPETLVDTVISMANPSGTGVVLTVHAPSERAVRPLTEAAQKVVRMRQRGLVHPVEILEMLTPAGPGNEGGFPPGAFVEHDLDDGGSLVPVSRPLGQNRANLVVGVLTNVTPLCPEGMSRVVLLGDPSREVGSVAEPECRRILGALDLAERRRIPLEWFTVSAGAKISMESGTENMDWISRVLRRLIEFTQAGGEVNVVVTGINVGAQPYWNAEATMLMHTRGILVMTRDGAMVLTGKTALDYSGSVSAEDNQGIGGYERVMGPNGQAQYFARDVRDACRILLRHYDHTYVVPGERFPRRAPTGDPRDRDVRAFPHGGAKGELATVGEIFADATNPGRKKPFDIRRVMRAVTDQDREPLERWQGMRDAEIAVVWDARLGGIPVCLLGIESRPLPRLGFVATDGPEHWTAGTLFPLSSKKLARAVNAASGNRPLVILANLSGFDGSPESMRKVQLEYGAEIGRAITNFRGPIVFCVVSRFHGGAFVVFSKALNDRMEVAALEGTYASVIGGAPAAAVVFARDVELRTERDPRVAALQSELEAASEGEKARLRSRLADLKVVVRSEKLGEVADEFDAIHSVHRALRVGSLDRIVPAAGLRPYLIDAVERGMARE